MTLSLPTVECGTVPSARLLRALAPFGLLVRVTEHPAPPPAPRDAIDRVLGLPGGSIALVTGPSGCGKTTLLRTIADTTHGPVVDGTQLLGDALQDRPVLDLLDGPPLESLRVLAAAGLAEPTLWARAIPELSEGQRLRLGLALAMARAQREAQGRTRCLVLLDEFCSTLDRVTARGIARTLRRWVSGHPGVLTVCATAHDDLAPSLVPDLKLRSPFWETCDAHTDRL